MFFIDNDVEKTTEKINQNVTLANVGLKEFIKDLKNAVNPKVILNDAMEINRITADMVRTVIGQGRIITNQLQTTMANATLETIKFGVTTQDNLDLFGAINNELKTSRYLTEEQIINMQAVRHAAGLTADEMAKFVVSFDTLGVGSDMAVQKVKEMGDEARSYGLNVAGFMKTVGENIKYVASYNFKGGVDGLSKMVAQAQSLRIDMGQVVSFAEDMMSPEKAIETAAGFQMLGGAVGALGDPFQLLHMAQTDMGGLQDSLVDMAAGAVSFNEETGEFDIPVTQMYRLREAAKLAGMSYQDFSEMALNSAKKTQKLELLDGVQSVPKEYREMIANLSQFDGGELKVKLPGQDEMVRVQDLTNAQIKDLEDLQKEREKSDQDLAIEANGYLKQIAGAQDSLKKRPAAAALESEGFINTAQKMVDSTKNLTNAFEDYIDELKMSGKIDKGLELARLTEIPMITSEMAENMVKQFGEGVDMMFKQIELLLAESNIEDALRSAFSDLNISFGRNGEVTVGRVDRSNTGGANVGGNDESRVDRSNTGGANVGGNDESRVDRSNMGNLSTASIDTIENAVINNINGAPTGGSSEPIQLAVTGSVNLSLENILTNASIDNDVLGRALANNQQFVADLEREMNNSLNTYNYRTTS